MYLSSQDGNFGTSVSLYNKTKQTTTSWYHNGFVTPLLNDCRLTWHDGKDHYNWVMKNDETPLSTDKRHPNYNIQLSIDKRTGIHPFSIESTELKKIKAVQKQIDDIKQSIEKWVLKIQSVLSFSSPTSKSTTIGNLTKKRKLVQNVDHIPILKAGKMQTNNIRSSQRSSATYLTTTVRNTDPDKKLNNMDDVLGQKL